MLQHILSRRAAAIAFAVAATISAGARQDDAVAHAKRVLDLLGQDKFEDVAQEFNAPMAAALSPPQLASTWTMLRQQAGAFTKYLDEQVRTPAPGITAVLLGCQFERLALDMIVSFDTDGKIAGLRFVPRPTPQPPAVPPASSRFTEESITVGAGEWALPGTLSVPAGTAAGALVLVHGSGPHDRDETVGANAPFRDLAWGLAERGIAVLRYEKRTREHGARMAGMTNLTVRQETTEDALLAAALLRRQRGIDPTRVFVLGHSLGGTLAPRIAAADGSLAGIIILAGSTRSFDEVVREQLAYLASLNPESAAAGGDVEAALQNLRRSVPQSYWEDFDAYRPLETAAQLNVPMLILQGERDYQVTLADLQGWRDALGGRANVTIKTYPALNHLFLPGEGKSTPAEYAQPGRIPDVVLDDIAGWIKSH